MAEMGTFRTGLNGFNKKDVLEYIDSMQSQHNLAISEKEQEIDRLRQELSETQKAAEENQEKLNQLTNDFESLAEENGVLKQEAEYNRRLESDNHRFMQVAEILRLEKEELSARIADLQKKIVPVTDLEAQLHTYQEQENSWIAEHEQLLEKERESAEKLLIFEKEKHELAQQLEEAVSLQKETEKQLQEMRETNSRYDGLVGDVGSFIMELHSMGQRFLEAAFKRSDSCLGAVETSVSALCSQLASSRAQVEQARQELLDHGAVAGLRLDELVQALEESAGVAVSENPERHE